MRKPRIVLNKADHIRLAELANGVRQQEAGLSSRLRSELRLALLIGDPRAATGTAQMGSTVDYAMEDGQRYRVKLVYPSEEGFGLRHVSVLTPIGVALLGLRAGQSVEFDGNDGLSHMVTVLSVGEFEAAFVG